MKPALGRRCPSCGRWSGGVLSSTAAVLGVVLNAAGVVAMLLIGLLAAIMRAAFSNALRGAGFR